MKCRYYLHFTEISPKKWYYLPQDTHLFSGRVGIWTQIFLMTGSILFPLYRKYLSCRQRCIMRDSRRTAYILERFPFRMVKIKALVWKPYFAPCPLARSDLGISVQFIRKSISCHGYEYGLQSQTVWVQMLALPLHWYMTMDLRFLVFKMAVMMAPPSKVVKRLNFHRCLLHCSY